MRRTDAAVHEPKSAAASLPQRPLDPPSPALRRRRRPRPLWLQKLLDAEHWLTRQLERRVLRRTPIVQRIYDRQLDRSARLVVGSIAIPALPPSLEGSSVLILSDLHAGPLVSASGLDRLLGRLAELEPDYVVAVGDFVTSSLEEIRALEPGLGRFGAGRTFGVLGNHDHYTGDAEGVRGRLSELGVEVLHNRGLDVGGDEGSLWLCGIDDWKAGSADLDHALAAECDGPRVLLSHNPDCFFEAADRGVDVMIAGHTHGGQIRLPVIGAVANASVYPFLEGHYVERCVERPEEREVGAQLVISQGLGVVGLPFRYRCPPEATLLTLDSAPEP